MHKYNPQMNWCWFPNAKYTSVLSSLRTEKSTITPPIDLIPKAGTKCQLHMCHLPRFPWFHVSNKWLVQSFFSAAEVLVEGQIINKGTYAISSPLQIECWLKVESYHFGLAKVFLSAFYFDQEMDPQKKWYWTHVQPWHPQPWGYVHCCDLQCWCSKAYQVLTSQHPRTPLWAALTSGARPASHARSRPPWVLRFSDAAWSTMNTSFWPWIDWPLQTRWENQRGDSGWWDCLKLFDLG